jgi:hypothetical protein
VPNRHDAPFLVVIAIAVLFGILIHRRSHGAAVLGFGGAFVGTAVAVTFGLFNVSWVNDPLVGRFLLFLPLVIVPLLLLASAKLNRSVFGFCVAVVLFPQFYWTATWFRIEAKASLQDLGYPTLFATPDATLSVDYRFGPPIRTEHGVVLAPSSWEEQSGRSK